MGGKTKKKRDWKAINEKYVKEGELWLDEKTLKNWVKKVLKKNKNKVGAPYFYPDDFMQFCGIISSLFHLHLRQLEGFLRILRKLCNFPSIPDYVTLSRRIPELPWEELPYTAWDKPIIIAQDSSGIKVSPYSEWIRHKWNVRRGFIKLHVSVNIQNHEVIGVKITNEKKSDASQFPSLINQTLKKGEVCKDLADGAYDKNKCFELLEKKGIEPAIKLRKNASSKRGCPLRRKEVRLRKQLGSQEAWRDEKEYGQRWQGESFYSSFKRRFGESVVSRSFYAMKREILRKLWVYNLLVQLS